MERVVGDLPRIDFWLLVCCGCGDGVRGGDWCGSLAWGFMEERLDIFGVG